MCAELPYHILTLIVAFDIAALAQRVWDCSHSGKYFSFRDRKSDASLRIQAVQSAHPSDSWASCLRHVAFRPV